MKEGDSTRKKVYHCDLCDKWFCEKHLSPKFPYFVDWDTVFDVQGDPEIKALFYAEYKREDGHSDFVYWRKTFEALDLEERRRNELIKKAMDRMMQSEKHVKRLPQKNSVKKPFETEIEEVHRLIKEANMSSPAMEENLKGTEKGNENRTSSIKKETKTTENKHGYSFTVPFEVYSDTEFREKLNNATTMHEVELITNEYYKRHYIKEDEEKPKKKHWWQ
jgi:hypothetical protein